MLKAAGITCCFSLGLPLIDDLRRAVRYLLDDLVGV